MDFGTQNNSYRAYCGRSGFYDIILMENYMNSCMMDAGNTIFRSGLYHINNENRP